MTTDTIAVVTGATRGLGLATARSLASRGTRVVLTYRGDADRAGGALDDVRQAGSDAIALPLDLADVASIEAFGSALPVAVAERWGRPDVDLLVNNAGIGRFGMLVDVTPNDLDQLLLTNVKGTVLVTQAVAPHLRDGGAIVNVSTMLTRRVTPGTFAYAASKAALETVTQGLALELGPRGIRVNTLAPGPTATDFNGGAMRDDETLRASLAETTAMGRVGEPHDIAEAIAALTSPAAGWMTGQRIEVSGGALI